MKLLLLVSAPESQHGEGRGRREREEAWKTEGQSKLSLGNGRRLSTHLVRAPLGKSWVLDTEKISLELSDTTSIHK